MTMIALTYFKGLDEIVRLVERFEGWARAQGDEVVRVASSLYAVPFYLAHPRLMQLERSQMLEVEGGTEIWCTRLLRHEAGHAIVGLRVPGHDPVVLLANEGIRGDATRELPPVRQSEVVRHLDVRVMLLLFLDQFLVVEGRGQVGIVVTQAEVAAIGQAEHFAVQVGGYVSNFFYRK